MLVLVVSVQVPQVAESPAWLPGALVVRYWRPDDLRSWSLGVPNAKVAMCEAEKVPKRRTQRTHCGQPVGILGAMGWCLPGSLFGFVFVL